MAQKPWELVQEHYPSGTEVVGRVRNLTSYGAFIEIEEGIDGLLHVSDMSWTRKVSHPSEVVQKGDTVKTMILEVDPDKRRVALGLKQLEPDPWKDEIPGRYRSGDLVRGIVIKLTSFGAFVELEDGLEGLLHISELSDKKIPSPEEIVDVGDVLDVRVIRVDPDERKIGLSLRTEGPITEEEEGPRIVIRSDELEEAEHPEALVQEAMEGAPQLDREGLEDAEALPEEDEEDEADVEEPGPRSEEAGAVAEETAEESSPEVPADQPSAEEAEEPEKEEGRTPSEGVPDDVADASTEIEISVPLRLEEPAGEQEEVEGLGPGELPTDTDMDIPRHGEPEGGAESEEPGEEEDVQQ